MRFKKQLQSVLEDFDLSPTPPSNSETEVPSPEELSQPEPTPEPEMAEPTPTPEPAAKPELKGVVFDLNNQLKGYDKRRSEILDELEGVIGREDADEYTELLSEFVKATDVMIQRLMTGKGPKSPEEILPTPEQTAETPENIAASMDKAPYDDGYGDSYGQGYTSGRTG
jgi:hypothetical protein